MTDMHDDFDETLRRAAAEYHRPPGMVPRDDMWAAIQARRSAPIALVTDETPAAVVPLRPRRALPAGRWWGLAAAASVLLATGIGIGRWTSGDVGAHAGAPGGAATVAATEGGAGARVPSTVATAPADPGVPAASERAVVASSVTSPQPARGTAPARALGGAAAEPRDPRVANVTYTLATLQHLTDVEALLVSYRSEAADSAVNARLSSWARDLVADTRLLLDSPAASDPRRRRLLEDLELVLVQLVQLDVTAPARRGAGTERELIDGSMQRGQLLTRLRSAIPAGT